MEASKTNPPRNTYQRHSAKVTARQLPADRLAELLAISKRTAQRYRVGDSTPPPAAVRLIDLELAGHILPADWVKLGLTFERGELLTPWGPLKPGMVQQYGWLLSNYRQLLNDAQRLADRLDHVYARLTVAEKLELITLKKRLPGLRPKAVGE